MRRIVVVVLSVSLLALAGGVAAIPASATTCAAVFFEPRVPDVVITATGRASVPVSVKGYDNCASTPGAAAGILSVRATAVNPGRDVEATDLVLSSGTPQFGTWTGVLSFDRRNAVGTWYVNLVGRDADQQVMSLHEDSFKLRRNTKVSANATPEPVERGEVVRVAGHVRKLTLNLQYVAFRDAVVRIYFQRAGRTTKTFMGKTRTNRDGRFTKSFIAQRSGRWYAYFPGSIAHTNRWSAADLVRLG